MLDNALAASMGCQWLDTGQTVRFPEWDLYSGHRMTTRQNVTRSPLIQTKETTPPSILFTSHGQPQIISLSAPLPSNLVSQLSKGKQFSYILHIPSSVVQPDDSASVSDSSSSSSSGCVNSCCAVCIPDKNCEVWKIFKACFFIHFFPKIFDFIFSGVLPTEQKWPQQLSLHRLALTQPAAVAAQLPAVLQEQEPRLLQQGEIQGWGEQGGVPVEGLHHVRLGQAVFFVK